MFGRALGRLAVRYTRSQTVPDVLWSRGRYLSTWISSSPTTHTVRVIDADWRFGESVESPLGWARALWMARSGTDVVFTSFYGADISLWALPQPGNAPAEPVTFEGCFRNDGAIMVGDGHGGVYVTCSGAEANPRRFTGGGEMLNGLDGELRSEGSSYAGLAIAFNGEFVFEVWSRTVPEGGRVLMGRRLTPDLRPTAPEFAISGPLGGYADFSAHGRTYVRWQPAIAADDEGGFGVVFVAEHQGRGGIYFVYIGADGEMVGAPARLSPFGEPGSYPRIAWDGEAYGVVWNSGQGGVVMTRIRPGCYQ